VTFTLSWRIIGIIGGALSLGFLAGYGVAFAQMQQTLPAEIAAQLIALVLFVIGATIWIGGIVVKRVGAFFEAFQPQLAENTAITRNVETMVNGERAALRQQLAVTTLQRDAAERVVHIVAAMPQCAGCRAAVGDLLEAWRIVRGQPAPKEPTS
jgi:hypothetical protein